MIVNGRLDVCRWFILRVGVGGFLGLGYWVVWLVSGWGSGILLMGICPTGNYGLWLRIARC